MPELPEVETVANGLRKRIVGKTVSNVNVLRKESIAYPTPLQFCKALEGRRVELIDRRGKYLLIHLSGDASLVVHLRMSGRLIAYPKNAEVNRHLRVNIKFTDSWQLHFEDMRVFGRLWFIPERGKLKDIVGGLKTLGVEPLSELTDQYLLDKMKNKKQPVKNTLLDQRVIAGIGNIYADETLFLAGIHPLTPAGKLKAKPVKKLVKVVKQVLETAIKNGGSTLRDYKTADGVNGNYQNEAWVYGQAGKECKVCKSEIQRIKLGGRSTHFCPECQK